MAPDLHFELMRSFPFFLYTSKPWLALHVVVYSCLRDFPSPYGQHDRMDTPIFGFGWEC